MVTEALGFISDGRSRGPRQRALPSRGRGRAAEGTGAVEVNYRGTVTNYSVEIYPSSWPGPDAALPYTRGIGLNVSMSTGGQGVAGLYFVPAGRAVPDGGIRVGTSDPIVFDVFMPMDDYTAILDLVRNETPVMFNFDDTETPPLWSVQAGPEEVGEDHGK
jgi:hypothetical protein